MDGRTDEIDGHTRDAIRNTPQLHTAKARTHARPRRFSVRNPRRRNTRALERNLLAGHGWSFSRCVGKSCPVWSILVFFSTLLLTSYHTLGQRFLLPSSSSPCSTNQPIRVRTTTRTARTRFHSTIQIPNILGKWENPLLLKSKRKREKFSSKKRTHTNEA